MISKRNPKHMQTGPGRPRKSAIVSAVALSALVSLVGSIAVPVNANVSGISNGDFELGTGGSSSISGWTPVNSRIDLGVTSIAGCTTVDTSNYSNLRDWSTGFSDWSADWEAFSGQSPSLEAQLSYYLGDWVYTNERSWATTQAARSFVDRGDFRDWWKATGRNLTPPSGSLRPTYTFNSDPTVNNDSVGVVINWDGDGDLVPTRMQTSVTLEDGASLSSPFTRATSQVVRLFSEVRADPHGYVIHGPAIYSEPFTAKTIDDLRIDWGASDIEDDHHVFGYLLNTATCAQTEVIDSTGLLSPWQTVSVAIPANGQYRFVFVSGTFDKTFGGVGGAVLYLDNIQLTVNEQRAEEERAAAGGGGTVGPPQVALVTPLPTISTSAGKIVNKFGANFDTVTAVYVGGIRVQILKQTANHLQIRIPRGLSGLVDLELKSPLNNVLSRKHFNLGGTASTNPRKAQVIVGGFDHNSRALTARMKARIDRWLDSNADLSTLTCTGFTSLPRRTTDVELSTNRGITACDYAKTKRPDLTTSVSQGVEDPRPGSNVRRVRLVLTP